MSSRAQVLARARAAREENKKKRQKGPWGGYVLLCVQRVEQRRRVGRLASDMLPELLLLVCAHALTEHSFCRVYHSRDSVNKLPADIDI